MINIGYIAVKFTEKTHGFLHRNNQGKLMVSNDNRSAFVWTDEVQAQKELIEWIYNANINDIYFANSYWTIQKVFFLDPKKVIKNDTKKGYDTKKCVDQGIKNEDDISKFL